jgi:hypothetical protein
MRKINSAISLLASTAAIMFLFCSCELINLKKIAWNIVPDGLTVRLAAQYEPIQIVFDTPMETKEIENNVQIKHSGGNVELEKSWTDSALILTPLAGWEAGRMYTCNFSGTIRAVDGRSAQVNKSVNFYFGSMDKLPYIVDYSPKNGAKTGVSADMGARLKIKFSHLMNRQSVEEAFSINGFTDKKLQWEDGQTLFVTNNGKNLSPFETLTWSVKKTAKNVNGIFLQDEASGRWTTDSDVERPKVLETVPVMKMNPGATGEFWMETGCALDDGLDHNQGIKVMFSKDMDEDSVQNSLRFEPSLSGTIHRLDKRRIVFVPSKDPAINTRYSLIISGKTEDVNGITMLDDHVVYFTPAINQIDSINISIEVAGVGVDAVSENHYRIETDALFTTLTTTFDFNTVFSETAKLEVAAAISLTGIFPAGNPVVYPVCAKWPLPADNTRLRIDWAGARNTEDIPHFYKLTVPGGANGITNGEGELLQQDIVIYLEFIKGTTT